MRLYPHNVSFKANGIVRFTGGMTWPNRIWIIEVSGCWGIQATQDKHTIINKAGAAQEPYAGAQSILQLQSGEFPPTGILIPSVGPFCTIIGLDKDLEPVPEWEARTSFIASQHDSIKTIHAWIDRFKSLNSSILSLTRE